MSGLVVKNNNELWFNNNKLSTSIGTKGLYMDNNRNLFFNNTKIASGNLNNALGLHLINSELAYDGIKFGSELNVLIRSLFANNEQGFAFDFNDLSTMYQDAAGTIPVTGVGQPVGRVLDKSGRGNHATQSTSAKRPILQQNATTGAYYLAFDGVDDCLVTSNIDFTGIKNLSLFASTVFNNSLSSSQFIAELSTDSYLNQGTFGLWRGYSGRADYALRCRIQTKNLDDLVLSSNNNTSVLTGIINSTSNTEYLRNVGVLLGEKKLTESSDTFKNFPLYIGGVSGYLNGQLYSLIGLSRVATTTEITNTEKVIAKNVGVTL